MGSVNWGLILASCGWMLSLESELKGKLSSGNLLALVSGKPMSSGSISLSLPRPRACAYCSETLTYSSGGSSREGLDLGGSFGRFLMARRFGRKLQTPFIGFGKGQGQLLSSRLRVLFRKPCNPLQPSRRFVASLGDPAAVGDVGMANPGNPRQFSIGEVWLRGD